MVYHKTVCANTFFFAARVFKSLTQPTTGGAAFVQSLKIETPPQTLREIAQTKIRDAIISGLFEPGQRLVERSLCEQVGVSRSVIREVIRTLQAEGLVDMIPKQGPIVAKLDWQQAEQIYDIRALLEAAAAADCARRADKTACATLREALDQLLIQRASGEASAVLIDTNRFYAAMFSAAGHQLAWDVVQRLNGRISRLRVLTLSSGDRLQQAPAHLESIYAAIDAGDAEGAATACRTHLTDAKSVAESILAKTTEI